MENRHEPTLDLSPYLDVIGKELEQHETAFVTSLIQSTITTHSI
jgi:hypothetical protein